MAPHDPLVGRDWTERWMSGILSAMGSTSGLLLLGWFVVTPAAQDAPVACEGGRPPVQVAAHGLTVCDSTSAAGGPSGVLIVEAGGIAAREGLAVGDRIYQVEGRPVESAREVAETLAQAAGPVTLVNFRRGPAPYLVRLPRPPGSPEG